MDCITFPSADCDTMRIEILNEKGLSEIRLNTSPALPFLLLFIYKILRYLRYCIENFTDGKFTSSTPSRLLLTKMF